MSAWGLMLVACAPSVPLPPTTSHLRSSFVPVEYPPPAARPQEIPEPPSETAVWIDGEWNWTVQRWRWDAGHWMELPSPDARYAAPTLRYEKGGELLFAPGTWRDAAGKALSAPAGTSKNGADGRANGRANRRESQTAPAPGSSPARSPASACTIDDSCPIKGEAPQP